MVYQQILETTRENLSERQRPVFDLLLELNREYGLSLALFRNLRFSEDATGAVVVQRGVSQVAFRMDPDTMGSDLVHSTLPDSPRLMGEGDAGVRQIATAFLFSTEVLCNLAGKARW